MGTERYRETKPGKRRPSVLEAHAVREVQALLGLPGCWLCHAEEEAEAQYFFWLIQEQYGMLEGLLPLRRARGLCHQHTKVLLQQASRDVVVAVYRDLAQTAARAVLAEDAADRRRQGEDRAGECPACLSRRVRREGLVRRLDEALTAAAGGRVPVPPRLDATALAEAQALCLWHLCETAYLWTWEGLRVVVTAVSIMLASPNAAGILPVGLLAGQRNPMVSPGHAASSDGHVAPIATAGGRRQSAGVPDALAALLRRLSRRRCVLCQLREEAAAAYVAWLRREVAEQPMSRWEGGLRLCRRHVADWGQTAGPQSWDAWLSALRRHWADVLQLLGQRLERRSDPRRWKRVAVALTQRLRATASSQTHTGDRWEGRARSLKNAWTSPRRQLDEWVHASFRPDSSCPACVAETDAVRRGVRWLAWALSTEAGARDYAASGGVCYRHLPLLLQACPERQAWIRQVHATWYRALVWELDEYFRKSDWNHRWEPRSFEQRAWLKAARLYSGVAGDPADR